MKDVFDEMLKENQFVILGFQEDEFLPLKVYRRQKVIMDYFPTQFVNNFYPMVPFGGTAVSGSFSSYFVSKVALQLKQIANVTNLFNMRPPDYPPNELLQVRIGVAPSPLRLFSYYPSNQPLDQISDTISWSDTTGLLNFGYLDGFSSPLNEPTEQSESFFLPNVEPVFSFENPTSITVTPLLRLYINQLEVRPVNNADMVKKLFDRIVPSKIVSLGGFTKGLKYTPNSIFPTAAGHFTQPIPLDASLTDISNAGYRGGY